MRTLEQTWTEYFSQLSKLYRILGRVALGSAFVLSFSQDRQSAYLSTRWLSFAIYCENKLMCFKKLVRQKTFKKGKTFLTG